MSARLIDIETVVSCPRDRELKRLGDCNACEHFNGLAKDDAGNEYAVCSYEAEGHEAEK